jgi:hypothetical protein
MKVPLDDEGAKVPVGEHPKYAKYFKMIKVGLPKDAIKVRGNLTLSRI